MTKNFHNTKAQAAIEYMLLLAVVVAIVLVGFRTLLKRSHSASNVFFNNVSTGIMGKPNRCGDKICDSPWETNDNCCIDCVPCAVSN